MSASLALLGLLVAWIPTVPPPTLAAAGGVGAAAVAAPPLASFLPPETLLTLEIPDPAGLLDDLQTSAPWTRFRAGVLGDMLLQRAEVNTALMTWATVARAVGRDGPELLADVAGGGLVLGLLPPPAGAEDPPALIVFAAREPATVQRAIDAALALTSWGNQRVTGERWELPLGDAVAWRRGALFGVASSAALIAHLDRPDDPSLADDAEHAAARRQAQGVRAWAWTRGALLHTGDGIPERLDDVGASLFAGGWNEVLRTTPWLAGFLDLDALGLGLRLVAPADAESLRGGHAPFFPASGTLEVPRLETGLATLVMPRELGPWWTRRDLYVTQRGVDESVEGDGNLSLIFQRDLGPEVLAWVEPELLGVTSRGPWPDGRPRPEYPSGALGLRLADGHPDDLPQAFVNGFFALITFTNFDNQDATRPMLQPDMELLADGARLYRASWRKPDDDERPLPERHNLSPALLLRGDGRIWISSSTPLLRELAAAPTDALRTEGERLQIDVTAVRELVVANSGVLIAQRTLEEGGDEPAAVAWLEALLHGLSLADDLSLQGTLAGGQYELSLRMAAR